MRFCIDRRQCLGNCASPGDHTEEGTNIVPKLKIIYSLSTDTGKLCNSLKLLTSDQLSGSTHARLPEMGRVNQSEDCVCGLGAGGQGQVISGKSAQHA